VKAVGGSKLTCLGWLPITFKVGPNTTNQPVYICDNIERIYFSKIACIDVNILSPSFPLPMKESEGSSSPVAAIDNGDATTESETHPNNPKIPPRPKKIPYAPKPENVDKLKQYLLEKFADTAFTDSTPFPSMCTLSAKIHLKEGAQPYTRHTPIPIPFHWKKEVKADLNRDVERGIIAPVKIGTPVTWCSPMVVTTKKDGRPRRTIDLQHLNSQCHRETHHCPSPFQLACQVPPNTMKTVLDAVDGYHAIKLDEESQHLTTFITEWGRYQYLRLPQGFVAANDAYTSRYDAVIKDVPRKIKIIDDTLLHDLAIGCLCPCMGLSNIVCKEWHSHQ
jgi:hypothetical protein